MKPYPRLKFCGLTRAVDVENAIEAGASAIGLNFVPASKRCIDRSTASELSRVAAGRIQRIGVFVNTAPEEIADLLRDCPLDAIQLHGDEGLAWLHTSQRLASLRGLPILRALHYRGIEDEPRLEPWCCEANDPTSPVSAILVDAFDPAERGGSGKTARWDLLDPRPASFFARKAEVAPEDPRRAAPMILAGGIHPGNVARACEVARPDGIDLASGIESSPGVKDREAMFEVAEKVRNYFRSRDAENPAART